MLLLMMRMSQDGVSLFAYGGKSLRAVGIVLALVLHARETFHHESCFVVLPLLLRSSSLALTTISHFHSLLALQFGSLLVPMLLSLSTAGAAGKNLRELGPRRLHSVIDFSAFSPGDVVSDLGDGVTVVAMKKTNSTSALVPGQAMIFDSAAPSGGDFDLGTPNKDYGGPGIGKAGKAKKYFHNNIAHGNVLIISEDEIASDPDDNEFGGPLVFSLNPPRYVDSIGLLDNDGKRCD